MITTCRRNRPLHVVVGAVAVGVDVLEVHWALSTAECTRRQSIRSTAARAADGLPARAMAPSHPHEFTIAGWRGRHVVRIFLDEVRDPPPRGFHTSSSVRRDADRRRGRPEANRVELFTGLVLRRRLARARGLFTSPKRGRGGGHTFPRVAGSSTFGEARACRQCNPYEGRGGPAAKQPTWVRTISTPVMKNRLTPIQEVRTLDFRGAARRRGFVPRGVSDGPGSRRSQIPG
jgi:hypothetical protein